MSDYFDWKGRYYMETLRLTGKKIKALRPGPLPIVMFILMTLRTITNGNAVMLSGLCVALIPFFVQVRSTTCSESYTEKQEIFSNYLLYLFFVTVGMLYLKGLTLLGAAYVPGYVPSPVMRELFLLTYICDVSFVSVLVPFTCALSSVQRMTLGVLLCNLEIGFMVFANQVLTMLSDRFVLHDQMGIYFITVTILLVSFAVAGMNIKEVSFSKKN